MTGIGATTGVARCVGDFTSNADFEPSQLGATPVVVVVRKKIQQTIVVEDGETRLI